jgi:hypothetical protein
MKSIKKLLKAIIAYPAKALLTFKINYLLHPVYSKHNKIRRTAKGTIFLILFGAVMSIVAFAIQRDFEAQEAKQRADMFEQKIKQGHDKLSYMLDNDPDMVKILSAQRFVHPVKRPRSK